MLIKEVIIKYQNGLEIVYADNFAKIETKTKLGTNLSIYQATPKTYQEILYHILDNIDYIPENGPCDPFFLLNHVSEDANKIISEICPLTDLTWKDIECMVSEIDDYGSHEEQGSYVFIVRMRDKYFQFDGTYDSYEGICLDLKKSTEVFPEQKTITLYKKK